MPQLEVIATGFNVKKLDPEAYGVKDRFLKGLIPRFSSPVFFTGLAFAG